VDEIPLSKTIKDLVGGKSTLQNEILSKSSPQLLKKMKNFLRNSVQRWEAASVVPLVNTVLRALFLVSLEAKCLVVSIRRLSRAISARTGD
jgi:fatty acid synthase subunit alpha-like protein